ncbi:hypothetical protein RIF29_29242 [Crotalaria pallida]|uniref:Uncharacterized protein n=1 Tax=Crotalaria pallida TaxID=3830 RepID=A0AAN9HXA8_CROPI
MNPTRSCYIASSPPSSSSFYHGLPLHIKIWGFYEIQLGFPKSFFLFFYHYKLRIEIAAASSSCSLLTINNDPGK